MKNVYLAINWVLGLIFLIGGLPLVIASSHLTGLVLLLTSLFFLPPVGNFIYSKTNKKISFRGKAVVIVASFILFMIASPIDHSLSKKRENIARFNDNREQIINSIKKELSDEKYDAAISLSDEYLVFNDDEIKELKSLAIAKLNQTKKEQKVKKLEQKTKNLLAAAKKTPASDLSKNNAIYKELLALNPDNKAYKEKVDFYAKKIMEQKTKNLLATAKKTPASDLSRNNSIYKELLALHPDNKIYKDKVDFYTKKVNEEEKIRKAKRERENKIKENIRLEAEKRKNQIADQFRPSGAHRKLERLVKNSMHDPSSYDHGQTIYLDEGDHLLVKMAYRGKNAFGAIVKNSIIAKVSLDGKILEILDQS